MTDQREVDTDERSLAVRHQSESLAYQVMSFLLLADVMYRSFRLGEAAWDLMGIVLAGGAFAIWRQANARILGHKHLRTFLVASVVGMAVAAMIGLLFSHR